MTPNTNTARVAKTTPATNNTDAAADQLLRDMAFVLRLTRRVKDEMMADRTPTQTATRAAEGALVA